MRFIFCEEAKKLLKNQDVGCCSSCHSDEEYGIPMSGYFRLEDENLEFNICCDVVHALDGENVKNIDALKEGE